MKRLLSLVTVLAWSAPAFAEDARFHVAAGGAHALGGSQSSEFGVGGAGAGTIELPATSRLGVQASAGAVALTKGDPPSDSAVAPKSSGGAFLGTAGVRLRAYGATRVAGPWIDSNVGLAFTGGLTRPAFDAHLGWDVRVSSSSRIDVGPFVGYTQIFQPDAELRPSDARILTAGLSFSLGAPERARPAEPVRRPESPTPPPAPPPPSMESSAEVADATSVCPDGEVAGSEGCVGEIRVFEDRIQLDDVVYFDFDSAKISQKSHRLVRNIARFINQHDDIVDISIEGHADEVGTEAYNQKLSEARATAMRDLLVRYGVEAFRLRIIGHGSLRPKHVVFKRDMQNRRVELYVTRTRDTRADLGTETPVSSNGRDSK